MSKSDDGKNNNNDDKDESIRASKKALRKEIRGQLRALSAEEIGHQSMAVWQQVWELPEYQEAESVGLFLSMPTGEIQTRAALEHALFHEAVPKQLHVPRVGLNFEECDMEMVRVPPPPKETLGDGGGSPFYDQWPRNKWQIPEPPRRQDDNDDETYVVAQPGDLDVLLVPGLAFDPMGGRLGQGKGYYDRFIQRMSSSTKKMTLIAVGLQVSLVSHVPTTACDRRMDVVVVPQQTIRVGTTDQQEKS